MKTRKEPWQKRLVRDRPDVFDALGPPRRGERIGQYLLRWQRHQEQERLAAMAHALRVMHDATIMQHLTRNDNDEG